MIDNDISSLTLIGIMIERGGFAVLKAADTKSALNALDLDILDMIILDMKMPSINDSELCLVIRNGKGMDTIPILIVAARNDTEIIRRGLESGGNDYLTRPILYHELVAKVRSMLGNEGLSKGYID